MNLTADTVAALTLGDKKDVIYFDDELTGFGFRLRLGAGGRVLKSWVAQYRALGSTRRVRLRADVLSAAQARQEAKRVLARATLGQDPQGDKAKQRQSDKLKVKPLVEEYLEEMRTQVRRKNNSLRRPATLREMTRYLLTGPYFRALHYVPVANVEPKDVAACLRSIRRQSSETTESLARSKLNSFFVWCMHEGYASSNPVITTRKPQRPPERERVLTDQELVDVWNACGEPELGELGKILRLNILIPARRSEIGGMRWSELDFDKGIWTLPGGRSKNHRPVAYPLMEKASQIIRSVPRRMGRDQLFGERAEGFTSWGKYKALLDARLTTVKPWLIHDIRRSVATKMADDVNIEPHHIEAILNHQSGHKAGPAGIYNRSNYEKQVRTALALWADHVRSLVEGGERKVLTFAPESVS
jgi:integrase